MSSPASPQVSYAAIWFLLAIVIVTVLLVLFYMCFTKKACFKNFKACDAILEPEYNVAKKSLANSYDESDSESSSDSDEETLRNIKKAMNRSTDLRQSSTALPSTSQQAVASEEKRKLSSGQNNGVSSPIIQVDDSNLAIVDESAAAEARKAKSTDEKLPSQFLSLRTSAEDVDWTADGASIYSNDASFVEEDEVAAGLLAKQDDDKDVEREWDEQVPISSCGTLDIALQYFYSDKKLQITILDAKDLPTKDRGGASIIQVRAVVLPAKRKRYKTKVQQAQNPYFGETFKLTRIMPEDLRGLGLRFRLYGIGKVRDRLIGEATVRLDELNLISDPQLTVTLQLEPRTDVNRSDLPSTSTPSHVQDVSAASALAHGGSLPEILLTLSYNEMTGRLMVEVVKGSHFRNLAAAKHPDTSVKLVLLNSSLQEMAQSKTTIRRSQPNPVFKETFYFQVALFQLAEVSLMVSVHSYHTIKRKSMLGWISLGRNSSSEVDDQHWQEMKDAHGKPVSRWHTLIES